MKPVIYLLGVLVIVVLGFYMLYDSATVTPGDNNGTATTTPGNNLITVSSPSRDAVVKSPLTITGRARGNWYFEATFPVKIVDANGKMLGNHYAQAEGDWMTTEFVPFSSSLTFATSTTPTGKLILEKDNPSGLPENDDSIEIPVRFQ